MGNVIGNYINVSTESHGFVDPYDCIRPYEEPKYNYVDLIPPQYLLYYFDFQKCIHQDDDYAIV